MAAIIEQGRLVWGIQLPIQSQSTIYVQEWEPSAGPDEWSLCLHSRSSPLGASARTLALQLAATRAQPLPCENRP